MTSTLDTVQERLRHWRKEVKGLSLREWREVVNAELVPERRVSLGTIANYERPPRSGGPSAGPRADFLAALKQAFPELRLEWLLLGEGEPSEVGSRVARASGVAAGASEPVSLAGRLRTEFPDLALLSPEASAVFLGALTRYAMGEPGMELTVEHILELAADLRWLLLLPLSAWGFDREPDYERFGTYSVALLHALTLLMPAPGGGDPIARYGESPLPSLRHVVRVGFEEDSDAAD